MAYDRTLVQIRERSFLDVLDLAVVVVRARPITLGLAAVAGALPFALFNHWLSRDLEFPLALLIMLVMVQAPLATAPLTIVLGGVMFGERPPARQVLRTLWRALVPLVVLQCVLRALFLMTFFAYVVFPARLAFLNEVILLERGGFAASWRRCMALTELRGNDLLGQWLVSLLFGTLFVLAFWMGLGALGDVLSSSELTWEPGWPDLLGVRFQVALWLAVEFFAIARFFAYIDQRIRLEGWEVELRLRSVGRATEDAAGW